MHSFAPRFEHLSDEGYALKYWKKFRGYVFKKNDVHDKVEDLVKKRIVYIHPAFNLLIQISILDNGLGILFVKFLYRLTLTEICEHKTFFCCGVDTLSIVNN